jgi:tetratricopeptide (TPR) repeat protein
MKSIMLKLFFAVLALLCVAGASGQRIIKGTVYREGEPAAGITVEANRGGTMMTSFDGKFQVEAHEKTKWLKFTFIDDSKRLDIDANTGNEIDFYFDGIKPEGKNEDESGVNNKSMDELLKDKDVFFMNEYTLYHEFYKQNDYHSALPHWQKLYKGYPRSTTNLYIHGVKMHESLRKRASSLEEKLEHLQKMMEIYDKRIRNFGEKGFVMGRKAVSWFEFYLQNEDIELEDRKEAFKKGYEWLKESAQLQDTETEIPVLVLIMNISTQLFKFGELPKETVAQNYDFCNTLLTRMLEKKDQKNREDIHQALKYVDDVFTVSGAADCEALISIYTPQFEEKGDDKEFIKGMLRKLRRARCDESDLYNIATERQYELDPSAEAAFNMARRFLRMGNVEKAKEYYKQAMEQETDNELLATYYFEYGFFVYARENALQEARSYARKALNINPDYCDALLLMGDIYVAASRNYGESDFEKATIFWLAVDYYNRAARVGEACSAEATEKAAQYTRYFPNKEEVFFQGLSEGDRFTIGDWINEATTVRF